MEREEIINYLEGLVGDEVIFDQSIFSENREKISKELFPAAKELGIDMAMIEINYGAELMESEGGPDYLSPRELYNVRTHLTRLLDKLIR